MLAKEAINAEFNRSHSQQLPFWPECQSDASCPASASLRAACGQLQDGRLLERLLSESAGDPRRYFLSLQQATQPVNISQSDRAEPDFLLRSPELTSTNTNNGGPSEQQVSILVIGDSIGREVLEAIKKLAPWATVVYFAVGVHSLAYTDKLAPHVASAVAGLHNCSFDAVFIGGFSGPWWLMRQDPRREKHADPMHDAYASHRTRIAPELARMQCLASNTHIPIVFLGGVPLDERTMMLTAKDGYWGRFKQYELAHVWTRVEQAFERTEEYASPSLHFLHTSSLAHECPGIRCDGVHFGSSFQKMFGCASTFAVWYPLVADFLIKLRLTNGASIAHHRNRCLARRSERIEANSSLSDMCLRLPRKTSSSNNTGAAAPPPAPVPTRTHVTDPEQWAKLQVARGHATALPSVSSDAAHLQQV